MTLLIKHTLTVACDAHGTMQERGAIWMCADKYPYSTSSPKGLRHAAITMAQRIGWTVDTKTGRALCPLHKDFDK